MSNQAVLEWWYGPSSVDSTALLAPDWHNAAGVKIVQSRVVFHADPSSYVDAEEVEAWSLEYFPIDVLPIECQELTEEGLEAMIAASNNMLRRMEDEGYEPDFV